MKIEVLYFDGCPNHEHLLERLPRLLETEGVTANVILHKVRDDDQARRERFLAARGGVACHAHKLRATPAPRR